MGFTEVRSFNFRNLENLRICPDTKTVLFVGENGQGKTNYLELLYILCFGSSFRTRRDPHFIRHGMKEMSLQGTLETRDGGQWHVKVQVRQGKKDIFLNDKRIIDRAELLSLSPCIVFSHEDISFVNGSPDTRRTFFNQTVSICEPIFIDALRTYKKILKARNAALLESREDLLDIYDVQLIQAGLSIMSRRSETLEEFNKLLTPLYKEISALPEEVSVLYRPSWPVGSDEKVLKEYLKSKREVDKERGVTVTGPHRDRFSVTLGKVDFNAAASTGQTRLLSLVYRVVQAARYLEKTGKPPILLLDDVLLELDASRRIRFLERLPEYEQAFFTFLPDEQYHRYRLDDKKVYTLVNGRAEEG
ncbi:MAG: DNA replication/repair protein RecF [Spirochaetales bacterium]|nr:DNA replication/repair protein RecF [Spirochaetales bacterium]